MKGFKDLFHVLAGLFGLNIFTMFGAALATTGAVLIVAVGFMAVTGDTQNPYIGIVAFVILPVVFVLGLLSIPFGAYLHYRAEKKHASGLSEHEAKTYEFKWSKRDTSEAVGLVGFLTLINFGIVSFATFNGVAAMESVEFCGTACHVPMEPEHTAYFQFPHSRVECVDCHIGEGMESFIHAKLNGVSQLIGVVTGDYSRPVPTPVEHLRPAAEICLACHAPGEQEGDRLIVRTKYSEDERNTPLTTVLRMRLGAHDGAGTGAHGWHMAPGREIRYYPAAEDRSVIPYVEVEEADGTVTEYFNEGSGVARDAVDPLAMRTMDCVDCHNRPAHTFSLPGAALDKAMNAGRISPELPYIKEVGMQVLQNTEAIGGDFEQIAAQVESTYGENYPEALNEHGEAVAAASDVLTEIYRSNVFPKMNVTWGTYPNHLGHTDTEGCFRCHTDSHADAQGNVIRQDCAICHAVVAWDEDSPEILGHLMLE